ncbi:MAG: hypothetical protein HW421_2311 [Ignavibacteria bacterium]|nr:hypothetical protein [Ignavibacteria bacterium]
MAKEDKKAEKQEPEKPPKKTREGGMKLQVLISIIVGVLAVQGVIVYILIKFVFSAPADPKAQMSKAEQEKKVKMEEIDKEKKKREAEMTSEGSDEADFLTNPEEIMNFETGQITTNPKSSSQFIVVNLLIEFRSKESKSFASAGKGEGGGGGEKESGRMVSVDAAFLNRIKGEVLMTLGDLTVDKLQDSRDTVKMIIRKRLIPIFMKSHEKKMFLRDITFMEYLIQ